MPSKKKKYNARFPAGRIKKIMQTDEEVGKVAQAVPVIMTLELFVESLLTKSMQITLHRNAKTLTPSHMKQCILSESRFDFLKDLVKNIPDASVQEDNENNALEVTDYSAPKEEREIKEEKPNFYTEQSTSSARTPVIQFSPKVKIEDQIKIEVPEVQNVSEVAPVPNIHIDLSAMSGSFTQRAVPVEIAATAAGPSAPPVMVSSYGQNTSDNLYIDEDYDN